MVLSLEQSVRDQEVEKECERGSILCVFIYILIAPTFPYLTSIACVAFAHPEHELVLCVSNFSEIFPLKRAKKVVGKTQICIKAYTCMKARDSEKAGRKCTKNEDYVEHRIFIPSLWNFMSV